MSRPDYVHCILREYGEHPVMSWCGRNVSAEFHFMDIDHAVFNAEQEGRLLICPECAEIVKEFLCSGAWEEEWEPSTQKSIKEIWVSYSTGCDIFGDGSKERPYKTIDFATKFAEPGNSEIRIIKSEAEGDVADI